METSNQYQLNFDLADQTVGVTYNSIYQGGGSGSGWNGGTWQGNHTGLPLTGTYPSFGHITVQEDMEKIALQQERALLQEQLRILQKELEDLRAYKAVQELKEIAKGLEA